MIASQYNEKDASWKRINMRNVTHLIGAEFIHDLYNRHLPRINSLRFRNTLVTWKNGTVLSFAPEREWDTMTKVFGGRLLDAKDVVLQEIINLPEIDRTVFKKFMSKLKKKDMSEMSNFELQYILIDLHYFVLGELYPVNLVQIEHALLFAIKSILSKYTPNPNDLESILSELITTTEVTETQKEERDFTKILSFALNNNIFDPKHPIVFEKILRHVEKYAYTFCAYGDTPLDLESFLTKFSKRIHTRRDSKYKMKKVSIPTSHFKINQFKNPQLIRLIEAMKKIGTFRDKNKALLGQTIKYKLNFLDELSHRNLENRENLNYYLISELLDLLQENIQVSKETVVDRKKNGVTFYREEYCVSGIREQKDDREILNTKVFSGLCASKGFVEGICKIILSKSDQHKMNVGDIMIAPGTDFNVMDSIYKSAGVITEEGGLLSHAAVVCRELKKPCCIGVKNITNVLQDGMRIRLDATNNKITIL